MVGNMLMAFSLGLIPFSVQYVLLRVFYAFEDTRTPFLNTLWVAGSSALLSLLCYKTLPARWAVVGMAACYGVSYAVGTVVALRRLKQRLGSLDGGRIVKTYTRLVLAAWRLGGRLLRHQPCPPQLPRPRHRRGFSHAASWAAWSCSASSSPAPRCCGSRR